MAGPDSLKPAESEGIKDKLKAPQSPEELEVGRGYQAVVELEDQLAKKKVQEIVDDTKRKPYEDYTMAMAENGDFDVLKDKALGLMIEDRYASLEILIKTLEAYAQKGGENAQKASQVAEKIKADSLAGFALGNIMPDGKFNPTELARQLSLLTQAPENHALIVSLFEQFQQVGSEAGMQGALEMLTVLKEEKGFKAETASTVLDEIKLSAKDNPDLQAILKKVDYMTFDRMAEIRQEFKNVAPPETEAEKLARRQSVSGTFDEIEAALNADTERAEAETKAQSARAKAELEAKNTWMANAYEAGIMPDDWSAEEKFKAKQEYEKRQKAAKDEDTIILDS